jgi:hypothetical protein
VHARLPPPEHSTPGFGAPLQQPLLGPITEREATAASRARKARHRVSRQGQTGLHAQWNRLREQLQPASQRNPDHTTTCHTARARHTHYTLGPPHPFPCSSQHLSSHLCGGGDVGAYHSATGAIKSALKYVRPDAHWIARRLVTAGGKRIKMRPLGTVVTSRYYVRNETTARLRVQRAPNQHEPCRPVRISEALHSQLTGRTGNPAQSSSAGYPLAACRIQPVAVRAARKFVVHERPFSGAALPHRAQRSPSASCRPACISNK